MSPPTDRTATFKLRFKQSKQIHTFLKYYRCLTDIFSFKIFISSQIGVNAMICSNEPPTDSQ